MDDGQRSGPALSGCAGATSRTTSSNWRIAAFAPAACGVASARPASRCRSRCATPGRGRPATPGRAPAEGAGKAELVRSRSAARSSSSNASATISSRGSARPERRRGRHASSARDRSGSKRSSRRATRRISELSSAHRPRRIERPHGHEHLVQHGQRRDGRRRHVAVERQQQGADCAARPRCRRSREGLASR